MKYINNNYNNDDDIIIVTLVCKSHIIIFNKKIYRKKIQRFIYNSYVFIFPRSDIIINDTKNYTKSISLRDGSIYSHEEIWKFPHRNRRYRFKGKKRI